MHSPVTCETVNDICFFRLFFRLLSFKKTFMYSVTSKKCHLWFKNAIKMMMKICGVGLQYVFKNICINYY